METEQNVFCSPNSLLPFSLATVSSGRLFSLGKVQLWSSRTEKTSFFMEICSWPGPLTLSWLIPPLHSQPRGWCWIDHPQLQRMQNEALMCFSESQCPLLWVQCLAQCWSGVVNLETSGLLVAFQTVAITSVYEWRSIESCVLLELVTKDTNNSIK